MVELVSGEDYKILDTIKLPPGVDGAVFNPVNQYYYVESGSDGPGAKTHALNIIDTKTFKHIGDIMLPGSHSEAMAIDKAGKKMYVNLTGTNEVGVVDLEARAVIARWPIPGAKQPTHWLSTNRIIEFLSPLENRQHFLCSIPTRARSSLSFHVQPKTTICGWMSPASVSM